MAGIERPNGAGSGVLSPYLPAASNWQPGSAYGDLASADGVSYGYDALGRMVTRADSSGITASMS